MRLRLLPLAVAALTLLSGNVAHAAGRDLITHGDVVADAIKRQIRLPVKVADRSIVYPIIKVLPQARVASAMMDAASAAATVAAALVIMNEWNGENGGGDFSWNSTAHQFERGESQVGTFFVDGFGGSQYSNANSPCRNQTFSQAEACGKAQMEARNNTSFCGAGTTYTLKGGYPTNANGYEWYYEYTAQKANGSACTSVTFWHRSERYSTSPPPGYTATVATEEQVADFAVNYSNLEALKNLFRNPMGYGISDNADAAGHEPMSMTQADRDALNEALKNGITEGLSPLVEELARFGREHGVTGAPDSTTVPDAIKSDGEAQGETVVNVNIQPDTPGGTFTEPELAEVGTFEETTNTFLAGLQAAPIVAAWSGISATVPTGSCPSMVFSAFGQSYDFMETGCAIWEDQIAPLIALCFLFVWPFVGLRIIMSA